MAKCRKCREKKVSVESAPKRPPRGSIRAEKRAEMRRQKMARLAHEAANNGLVEFGGSDTVS